MKCPCNPSNNYKKCCGKIHKNIRKADTPEKLMRSRYSAFTLADGDYLMKSHHESTRPIKEKEDIVIWAKSVKWLSLEVLEAINDIIEFKAYYIENSREQCIHERSKFVQEDGVWYYLEAV